MGGALLWPSTSPSGTRDEGKLVGRLTKAGIARHHTIAMRENSSMSVVYHFIPETTLVCPSNRTYIPKAQLQALIPGLFRDLSAPVSLFSGAIPTRAKALWPYFFQPVGSVNNNIAVQLQDNDIAVLVNAFETLKFREQHYCVAVLRSNFNALFTQKRAQGFSQDAYLGAKRLYMMGLVPMLEYFDIQIEYDIIAFHSFMRPRHVKIWRPRSAKRSDLKDEIKSVRLAQYFSIHGNRDCSVLTTLLDQLILRYSGEEFASITSWW
jgi:hypothetical protein